MRVLSTMAFPPEWLADVAAVSDAIELEQRTAERADELPPELLREVEVLYTGAVYPTPAEAPRLRWIQLDTSGADHLRGSPLWDSDVVLTSLNGVSPRPMAEYVMAMVLGFAHRLPRAVAGQQRREWPTNAQRWEWYRPVHVPGSRMTIVGYGAIGRGIARAAAAFGIEVCGVRRGGARTYADEPAGVTVVTADRLHEALAGAHWVVVCVPGTPQTAGLIGSEAIAAMQPGAVLIDVARGGVVDEPALLAALRGGHLGGAALDVFTQEPLPPSSPLWDEPGVVVTPHISGLASDYEVQVGALFRDNLRRYLAGEPLRNVIDRAAGY